MNTLTLIVIGLIISATVLELIFVLIPTHDKKLITDARSNIVLGVIYFLTDLFIRKSSQTWYTGLDILYSLQPPVHHGTNRQYPDKNLGGVLMIFDHLFGTYAKEVEPPVYGIVHRIDTSDPYKITTHEYVRVIKEMSRIKGVFNKLRYLFSAPD